MEAYIFLSSPTPCKLQIPRLVSLVSIWQGVCLLQTPQSSLMKCALTQTGKQGRTAPTPPHPFREAVIKKKIQNVNFFQKGGGVDPKVYIFEIFNFGKFQVSKWASGMKRLFKVSFKN